jgi:hypothetical protein
MPTIWPRRFFCGFYYGVQGRVTKGLTETSFTNELSYVAAAETLRVP